MFVLARHQNIRIFTAVGRRLLAWIIVAIAIANVVTVLVEVPWDTTILMQQFFDLGGVIWERASAARGRTRRARGTLGAMLAGRVRSAGCNRGYAAYLHGMVS